MIKKKLTTKDITIIISTIIIIGSIIFMVGTSYGFFNYAKQGNIRNIIGIKSLSVEVNQDSNALNLAGAEPLYDSEGLQQEPFVFTVGNPHNKQASFRISIVGDTEKENNCVINEGTVNEAPCPILSRDNIRYSYKVDDGEYSEPANLGVDGIIINTANLQPNESKTYSIKLWIKSDASNDIMGKYFFGNILLQELTNN